MFFLVLSASLALSPTPCADAAAAAAAQASPEWLLEATTPTPEPRPSVAKTAAIYFSGPALDLALTEYGLARGGVREGNPLMQRRDVRYLTTIALPAAMTYYDLRQQRQGKKPRVVRAIWVGAKALIVAHNVRLLLARSATR